MADDNAESGGTDLSRRRLLSLPAKSFVGYGALKSAVDRTSADPDVTTTANEVPPSETILDEFPLPSDADSLELEVDCRIWASAVSDGARTEFYAGDVLIAEVACTPDQAGGGCYNEDNIDDTFDLSQHAGETIQLRYETVHRGGIDCSSPLSVLVDNRHADLSEFPLPELEGSCVVGAGNDGEFHIPQDRLHDSVVRINWDITELDSQTKIVDEQRTRPAPQTFTFDEPGEYLVEAEPAPTRPTTSGGRS